MTFRRADRGRTACHRSLQRLKGRGLCRIDYGRGCLGDGWRWRGLTHEISGWWRGNAQGRSRRGQVRLEAAEMFAQDADMRQIARLLRVSAKSVYRWRRAWRAGGEAALAFKGPGGERLQAGRGPAGQAGRSTGCRPGRLRLGPGSAVDAGPGRGADRPAVPRVVHAAGSVVPAAPSRVHSAGRGAPGRRAGTR